MADNKIPRPPTVADPNPSLDELWLVSYADDDDRELTAPQIAAALERGEIDANTIVWRDGMPEWKAIAEVDSLRSQLRRVSHAPETLRRRQTVLGGFGPAQPPTPAGFTPGQGQTTPAPAPGLSLDDDEPTVIQASVMDGFASTPNQVRPDPSPQRGRHPTSGNTLRIKTSEPPPVTPREPAPVTPREPTHDRITPQDFSRHGFASSPRAAAPSEPELESLPSALLVTATSAMNVSRKSSAPPTPTRGVMSRQSEPPGTPLGAAIPRAALTREPDSDAPPAPRRAPDAPKPPVPRDKSRGDEPESLPSDAVKSVVSTTGTETKPPRARPSEDGHLPSVQVRDDYAEADLSRQRTRPPRSRREGWVESGTPPPIGELSEAAARIAQATSHPPAAPFVTQPPVRRSSGALWVGLGVLGVAAVAGAFALGKRSGETNPGTSAQAIVPVQATPAGAPSPIASSPVTAAADDTGAEADVSPSDAVTGPSQAALARQTARTVKPTVANPPSSRVDPKPAEKSMLPSTSSPAAPQNSSSPSAPANGSSVAAEKPSDSAPGAFDASAAAGALGTAASRASSCRQPGDPSGVARVTVTFANSGSATHALVDGPPFAGTATGGCIASTMRGATVPPFTGERVTVKKTVVIQ